MDKEVLVSSLDVLRNGRCFYIEHLLNDLEINMAFFKYRKSPSIMSLIIEKYKTECMNNYLKIAIAQSDSVRDEIVRIVMSIIDDNVKMGCSDLSSRLLAEKKAAIERLIDTGDKMEKKHKELLISIERDKALYEDEIKKMEDMI